MLPGGDDITCIIYVRPVPWVGYICTSAHRSCTTSDNGRSGSRGSVWFVWSIWSPPTCGAFAVNETTKYAVLPSIVDAGDVVGCRMYKQRERVKHSVACLVLKTLLEKYPHAIHVYVPHASECVVCTMASLGLRWSEIAHNNTAALLSIWRHWKKTRRMSSYHRDVFVQ